MKADQILTILHERANNPNNDIVLDSEAAVVSSGLVVRGVYSDRLPDVPTICFTFHGENQDEIIKRISSLDPAEITCARSGRSHIKIHIKTEDGAEADAVIASKYRGMVGSELWALQLAYHAGPVVFVRTMHIISADGSILTDSKLRRVDAVYSFLLQGNSTVH